VAADTASLYTMRSVMEFQDRVLEKLDQIQTDVTAIKVDNAKQTAQIEQNTKDLAHHIKRSDLLEESLEQHKSNDVRHKKPMTVKDLFIKLTFIFGGVGTIAGATYGILRLLEVLK